MNPLNGLENIGTAFTGFTSGVRNFGAEVRRWGREGKRRIGNMML